VLRLLLLLEGSDEEAGALFAVRRSELRCVSVVVVVELSERVSSLAELGVFAALGVFVVEVDGMVQVVGDSATRLCSSIGCCCLSLPWMALPSPDQLAPASAPSTAAARIFDA
jgi:hypothetical protein